MARTLDELIVESTKYIYSEPIKDKNLWHDDDYFFKAIYIVINTPDLLKASQIICGWFSPLKLLFKATIKRYIQYLKGRDYAVNTWINSFWDNKTINLCKEKNIDLLDISNEIKNNKVISQTDNYKLNY